MATSPPESYALEELDVVRELLDNNIFTACKHGFLDHFFGSTPEEEVKRSYEEFKDITDHGEDAVTQYFMSAGLIAKDEPGYRKDKLFDFLYESLSDFELEPSRDRLESVYYNLEK